MSGWAQRDAERQEEEAQEFEALLAEVPDLREQVKRLAGERDEAQRERDGARARCERLKSENQGLYSQAGKLLEMCNEAQCERDEDRAVIAAVLALLDGPAAARLFCEARGRLRQALGHPLPESEEDAVRVADCTNPSQ